VQHYQNDLSGRGAVVDTLRALADRHLNRGTAGNVSARTGRGMLITPTGIAPDRVRAEQIVHLTLDGAIDDGQLAPSSEWQMHADVYRTRPDVNAVVHCHSPYATILACARRAIPAMHYMVAAAGGRGIPLADYATFGTRALSQANMAALAGHSACLLANHGQLATGPDLESALNLAELVEEQAHCYWGTLAIGGPVLLQTAEMDEVLSAFGNYGQQQAGGGNAGEASGRGN
jgi:L-fuculose-phosphate aldolase